LPGFKRAAEVGEPRPTGEDAEFKIVKVDADDEIEGSELERGSVDTARTKDDTSRGWLCTVALSPCQANLFQSLFCKCLCLTARF